MTSSQTPHGGARHERRPPRRDRGWVALLALTGTGLLASFLVSGDDPETPPAAPQAEVVDTSPRDADPDAGGGTGPTRADTPSPPDPPSTPEVVTSGEGTLVQVPVKGKDSGRDGRVMRWTMQAEKGLGIELEPVGELVREVLQDKRGWEREEGVSFRYVSPTERDKGAEVDVTVVLASPDKTDELCAPLATAGEVSCMQRGKVVLNSKRWLLGAEAFVGDLDGYRTYLINHEMGHALGHGHLPCPAKGERAPVMMQQTLSVGECKPWSWPVGDGAGAR